MKTRWVVLGAMVLGAAAPARGAQSKDGPPMGIGQPGEQCVLLVNLLQPLRATPGVVQVSDPVTLDWRAGGYPPSCLGVWFRITGPNIDRPVGPAISSRSRHAKLETRFEINQLLPRRTYSSL